MYEADVEDFLVEGFLIRLLKISRRQIEGWGQGEHVREQREGAD